MEFNQIHSADKILQMERLIIEDEWSKEMTNGVSNSLQCRAG
jgi:hypothetical protein